MNRVLMIVVSLVAMGIWQPAFGQFDAQLRNQGFYRGSKFSYRSSARGSTLSRPTISPYLALTDFTGSGADPSRNYFTQVRPQLQNQARQQRQQRSINNLQRNVASINSAVARANRQQYARSTGHPTRFMTYLQYYPGLSR